MSALTGTAVGLARLRLVGLLLTVLCEAPLAGGQSANSTASTTASGDGACAWDARIQTMVDQVDDARLRADVDHLSNSYWSRVAFRPEAFLARDWLVGAFQSFGGLTVTTQDYNEHSDNVIAELTGAVNRGKIVIVGAHYDSVAYDDYPDGRSPGADDNASGVAAVLEAARILSADSFENTIRFIAFCSEENHGGNWGVGSEAYASLMDDQDADIIAMVNIDGISYRAPGDGYSLDIVEDGATDLTLVDFGVAIGNLYVPGFQINRGPTNPGFRADHWRFFEHGYSAMWYFEDLDRYSPYFHTINDALDISANDFHLCRQITRCAVAAVAQLAAPLDLVIEHAPLEDQDSVASPYTVRAVIRSLTGTQVASAGLFYSTGGAFTEEVMLPSGGPDEWIGQIPVPEASTRVNYYIVATDDQGAQEWLPDGRCAGDESFGFRIGVEEILFQDDFETYLGWTHGGTQDDWQCGAPEGESGDPPAAYSGVKVWGNDLGAGAMDGAYMNSAANWLRSPMLNARGHTGVHLRYRRHLAVEDGLYDQALIKVNDDIVWQNAIGGGSDHQIDQDWTLHDIDISAQADDNPDIVVRFELVSDGALTFGGWTIDLLQLIAVSPPPAPELSIDTAYISLATGGTAGLRLDFGAPYAGRGYVVLAGASGTEPGFDLGGTRVPLNIDAVTFLFLRLIGALPGWTGALDSGGGALASLVVPPGDPSLAGVELSFVAITLQPTTDNASNAVSLLLIP